MSLLSPAVLAGSGDDLRGGWRCLQAALNAARPGDTILLQEGAEFVGSFVLPAKTGDQWITLRSARCNPERPLSTYAATANHTPSGPGSAVTMIRP